MTRRRLPMVQVRRFIAATDGYPRISEWDAAVRRMRVSDRRFATLHLPAKVNYPYWITGAREHGRIHIATGRAVRMLNKSARPDQIVIEIHCQGELIYPRGVESPDAAPSFTLCPRCVEVGTQRANPGTLPRLRT